MKDQIVIKPKKLMLIKSIKHTLAVVIASSFVVNAFASTSTSGTSINAKTASLINSIITSNFTPKLVSDKQIANYFHRLLPTTTINSIYTTPYPDTYALAIGVNLVYGNLHSSYLMAGHLFNIYTQDDITTKLQQQTVPKLDITKLNVTDAVIAKSANKVSKKLIVFVDPDCPYCRTLEKQIIDMSINDKADIYYMLMPLSIHPNAKTHVNNILCSKDQLAILKEYMLNNNDNPKLDLIANCSSVPLIERIGSVARSLNINGTPAIVTGSGKLIMGDDINAINDYLNK